MNNKTFWNVSRYKKLTLLLAVIGSGGYLLTTPNFAFAAESSYDDEEFPPKYLDMEQFVITADRTPVNKWATPSNVITITDKDIEANHYQTLAEALNHVNGIIVPVGSNIPVINGLEKVLILIDGHQLYNDGVDYRDTVELSAIPSMKNIKRIEIVKGGGSALYGSDAVTGIINIITKKGERHETTLDFNAGSWKQRNYEVTNQGVLGNFSWFVTGGFHKSDPFNYPGGAEFRLNLDSRESDRDDKAFTGRFDYEIDYRNSITLSVAHIDHKYNSFYRYTNAPHYRNREMKYNNVLLVYNFKENTQTPGWLRYFNDSKFRDDYTADTKTIRGISKFRVQGVDYQNSWILGQNKIVTGLEWHQMSMAHSSWNNEDKKTSNRAFYLQDMISMGKKWKLIPGFRYDHNSEFGHKWSPKIAANYRADDQTKIYASWGQVYKAATPYQLYEADEGNENLRPEKGHTGILGIEHNFGDKTNLNFSLFYANLKDAIDSQTFNEGTADEYSQFINVNKEKSRGAEVSLKHNFDDKWSCDFGYTYTKVDIDGFNTSGSFTQPRNTYNLGVHYNHGIWSANLLGVMGHGGLNSTNFDSTKYAVLDFNVDCKVHENATVYLKFNNLTNKNYSFYGKQYNDDGTISRSYHSPGRSFIAGVEIKF